MYDLLNGMRIVESVSFVAGPSCGLYLLQFGAEVIRIDPIGGGPDSQRWPLSPRGGSFYWEGLNKGKKSIAIDLSRPEGRELASRLITASGPERGIFLTNSPPHGFLSHARLSALRSDLISVRIMGWGDGGTAMDPTVNAAFGMPYMTGGIESADRPVNHALPAWDLVTGCYAAFSLLAAERQRRTTGHGQEVRIPLGDIAATSLANLGHIAEVTVGSDRARTGNDLFGAFGRDFLTRDGHRVMVVAITPRQWSSLLTALKLEETIAALEAATGVSFKDSEGRRFEHRHQLFPIVEAAIACRTSGELAAVFGRTGVCWSTYRSLKTALAEDTAFSAERGLFEMVEHPSGYRYATPGAAGIFCQSERREIPSAPRLGQHTDEVLAGVLNLSELQIGRLHDDGLVAGSLS
jgi:2-methylfumaryl-CoA isomerase